MCLNSLANARQNRPNLALDWPVNVVARRVAIFIARPLSMALLNRR